ncbi:MAG: EamA family transporter [Elusimicrobia bacterium]|nr:EamA family transporter [Elusimicrobiota bacterium]
MDRLPVLFALAANLCFAAGSLFYTRFARRTSAAWVNAFKALLAAAAFALTVTLSTGWLGLGGAPLAMLLVSGAVGLGLGDVFLVEAMARMGPGRTLMIFAFQPLVLGTLAAVLLGQPLDARRLSAVGFFMLCLATISHESRRRHGHWNAAALGAAGVGMLLDCGGILLTRSAFDAVPALSSVEGNFYRCLGALGFFFAFSRVRDLGFRRHLASLGRRELAAVTAGSLLGCYASLLFYLAAIKHGHLAAVSGVAITSTAFASALECAVERRRPSLHLGAAFAFFAAGMTVLLR